MVAPRCSSALLGQTGRLGDQDELVVRERVRVPLPLQRRAHSGRVRRLFHSHLVGLLVGAQVQTAPLHGRRLQRQWAQVSPTKQPGSPKVWLALCARPHSQPDQLVALLLRRGGVPLRRGHLHLAGGTLHGQFVQSQQGKPEPGSARDAPPLAGHLSTVLPQWPPRDEGLPLQEQHDQVSPLFPAGQRSA